MKRSDDNRHLEITRGDDRSPGPGWEGWLPRGFAPPSPRWSPESHVPEVAAAPWEALRYVVVDDLYDDSALLISYMWPSVTGAGTLYFGDDPRLIDLSDGGVSDTAWRDSGPGMPIVFREIPRNVVEEAPGGVQPFELDTESDGAWMPREHVQEAVDTARVGGDPSRATISSGEEAAPELRRSLRIGDTFAVVITNPDDVEVIVTDDDPPTELVALLSAQLIDITRQARTAARAAQVSALSKPIPLQALDEEIEGSAAKASAWELEGDTEIPAEGIDAEGGDTDPRDAQPTV